MHQSLPLPRAAWLAAVLIACLAGAADPRLKVEDPWVRGTVEGQSGSGAYLRLTAREDAQLVGASAPIAERVEIHEMHETGNRMTMRRIDSLPLPAGRTVSLTHGYHIMFIGLRQTLTPGMTVDLVLHLRDAKGAAFDVPVRAPVRPLATPLPHE